MLQANNSAGIFRNQLMSELVSLDFSVMGKDELVKIQQRLGMGCEWGVWEFQSNMMPAGQLQHRSMLFIEMKSLCKGVTSNQVNIDRAWIEILRYGVVRSVIPGLRGIAKPSTVSSEMSLLVNLARKILSMPFCEGKFWSLLAEEDVKNVSVTGKYLLKTLRSYFHRGLLPDAPLLLSHVEGLDAERDRYGEENGDEVVKNVKMWQPLPDEFTSECGWRSLKIIKDFGPTLLSALEVALHSFDISARQNIDITDMRDSIIRNWNWTSHDNSPLSDLGFELNVKQAGKKNRVGVHQVLEWPPKTFFDAWKFLSILQGAHLFPVCLASGPRASEVSSLNVNCLEELEGGKFSRISGKTYKLVEAFGGRDRDFAAPEIVVSAIKQQIRLSELVKARAAVSGDHLWVHLTSTGNSQLGAPHNSLSDFMESYCKKLKLGTFLGADAPRVHLHRFRKTLARVVALSLVNSPTILMDCFGHEDPKMTILNYILSDKRIARDVLLVQRELVVMMAVEVINNSGELGGAVGEQLRIRKAQYLQLLGKSEFEPQDAYEFARRETFDGRSWMMVAPGIYCTLPNGEGGLCSKGQGGPNPAYCQAGCPFQLLTTYNKIKTEDAIMEIIKNLQRAVDEDETMLVAQWSGQLKNWIYRWAEIAEKWRDHPLVQLYAPVNEVRA
jgi:hypothetical protein